MNPLLRHDERSYRGHGPLLPPRPCSSERARPAINAPANLPIARDGSETGHARYTYLIETNDFSKHLSSLKGKRVEKLTAPKSVCINLA